MHSDEYLNPSEAARRLGVTVKALRIYEGQGLLAPVRTEAGWRVYGPKEMDRAAQIVALRALDMSLQDVALALSGNAASLDAALERQATRLGARTRSDTRAIARIETLRAELATGRRSIAEIAGMASMAAGHDVSLNLPWPWAGERFEVSGLGALTFITGPLGSGKTRLSRAIAECLSGRFVEMERGAPATLDSGLSEALAWLKDDGAAVSEALTALMHEILAEKSGCAVIDLVEHGLEEADQRALMSFLRRRWNGTGPLFLLTRSTAILDLDAVMPGERIVYCPANHAVPLDVVPVPGSRGYEATATCLATPDVRARTAGVIAVQS